MIIKRATNLNIENLVIDYQKVVNVLDATLHGIRMDMSVTEDRETDDTENPDYWNELTIHEDKKTKALLTTYTCRTSGPSGYCRMTLLNASR